MGVRYQLVADSDQFIANPGKLKPLHGTFRNLQEAKLRTSHFEVWDLVKHRSSLSLPSLTPVQSPTFDCERPLSELDSKSDSLVKYQVPNLGPTRQETRKYLRRKRHEDALNRNNVLPIDGPTNISVTRKPGTNDLTVFDDKAANDVIVAAENQHKSGYPTLATSSMLARRNRIVQIPEESEQPDMKFFAELVKPIQYRWKFQKEKLKTLSPSKHGFHPRSKSPTFHRLIEATEKLQFLSQGEHEIYEDRFDNIELETQSQTHAEETDKAVLRYTRSEPYSTRSSNVVQMSLPKSRMTEDFTPEIKSVSKNRDDETFIEEDEEDDSYQTPDRVPTPPKVETKKEPVKSRTIDLKRLESHTEIHLFLPQIQDQMSRGATPDTELKRNNKVVLPIIKDSSYELKAQDEEKIRPRKDRYKTDGKRKKRKFSRVKSGSKDKNYPDILNDVPTLISMEKEKPSDYHPASMCVFENCKYHSDIKKTNRIRQP